MKRSFFNILMIALSVLLTTLNYGEIRAEAKINEEVYTEQAETDALGVAGNFNLFILEDLELNATDTEGRMAVGGHLNISKFGIGDKVDLSYDRFDLIAGGNVKIRETENKSGNTLIDNTSQYEERAYGHLNNVKNPSRMDTKTFFEKATKELQHLTDKHNRYEKNGTVKLEYGALRLMGTHPDYNVFEVNAADLASAIEVKIEVQANSTVIINVIGETVTFPIGQVFYNGLSGGGSLPYASTILWNLPQATSITTKSSGVFGSILAPYANVDTIEGQINGNLIARRLEGHIESHLHLFRPRVMPPDPTDEFVSLSINKRWDDEDNFNQKRPSSITVQLIENDDTEHPFKTIEITEAMGWTYTFDKLEKYKDGKEIKYTIIETPVDHYESSQSQDNNIIELTNTYYEEVMRLSIEKQWDDDNNKDKLRPQEIIVLLIANSDYTKPVLFKTIKPDAYGFWKAEIENLPVYKDGKKIDYKLIEKAVDGYVSKVNKINEDEFVLVNTRDETLRDIKVSKVWDDENNKEGFRPKNIEVSLIADGDVKNPIEVRNIEADAFGNWETVFEDLVVSKNNQEIQYSVIETDVEYYQSEIRGSMETGFIINNKRKIAYRTIDIEKVWDDDNNKHKLRPSMITVSLIADNDLNNPIDTKHVVSDAQGKWKLSFTDLPVYKNKKEIVYTVVEEPNDAYQSKLSGSMDDGFILTNTLDLEFTSITIHKIWDDQNNLLKKRPENITVYLYADDILVDTATLSKGNQWMHSFEDLLISKDNQKIVYRVEEAVVEEYQSEVIVVSDTEIQITNTLKPTEPIEPIEPREPTEPTNPIEPSTPKTGINNSRIVYMQIIVLSLGLLISLKALKKYQ